jgi:ketosteroid isomerase-like protein
MTRFKTFGLALLLALPLAVPAQATNLEAEITAFVESFHAASTAGDLNAIERHISRSPDAFFMGSDATEIFIGHDDIVQWWVDLFAYLETFGYSGLEVVSDGVMTQINRVGPLVLVADEATWRFNNGDLDFRLTLVLRKEQGRWKILHGHFSNPLPNDALPL